MVSGCNLDNLVYWLVVLTQESFPTTEQVDKTTQRVMLKSPMVISHDFDLDLLSLSLSY